MRRKHFKRIQFIDLRKFLSIISELNKFRKERMIIHNGYFNEKMKEGNNENKKNSVISICIPYCDCIISV